MNITEETRKDYESPTTTMMQVEIEGSLCGSATITNPQGEQGEIDKHMVNDGFNITTEHPNSETTTPDDWGISDKF